MAKALPGERLTAATHVDEAATKLIAHRLATLRQEGEHVAADASPDAVHDARVAARRLQATLDFLGGPLDEFADDVRRLVRALGRLRDRHVTLAWVEGLMPTAEEDERAGLLRLIDTERTEIAPLETLVREALRAFEHHVARPLDLRLDEAGWSGALGGGRVRRRLAKRLDRLGDRLAALADVGLGDARAAHELRIAGKKARYRLELVDAVFPGAEELLVRLKAMQEHLGLLHDDDVRLGFLTGYVVSVTRPEQPGAVRLLREALTARAAHAAALAEELPWWQDGHRAHAFAHQLRAG